MAIIFKEQGIWGRIPKITKSNIEQLPMIFTETRDKLCELKVLEEGEKTKFTGEYAKQLPQLKKNVNKIMEELEDQRISDVMANADDVLKMMEEWEEKVNSYKTQSSMQSKQAETLELKMENYD